MSDVLDALDAGDEEWTLRSLAGLSRRERRALFPVLLERYRRWHKGDFGSSPDQPSVSRWEFKEGSDAQRAAAATALLAVATAAELTGRQEMPRLGDPDSVLRLVAIVTPPWLDAPGLERLVDGECISWVTVERLVVARLCEWPRSPKLIEMLVQDDGFFGRVPLLDRLREHPRLFDDGVLYRLFEVEGGTQSSLAAVDKYRANDWASTLETLSRTGELERRRLLDGSLDALERDFAQFRAGWFSRFHDRLRLTDEERWARRERYLRLLASSIPPTVSWALGVVEKLDRKGAYEAAALVSALAAPLEARAKGTARRAARLLARSVERSPRHAAVAAELAIRALEHPDVDVQSTLLDLVDRLLPQAGQARDALSRALVEQRDLLAPSLRVRLALDRPVESVDELPRDEAASDPYDDAYRLEGVLDVEGALDAVAFALEHPDDAIAQELALDAVARFPAPGGDWQRLSGPLRSRASKLCRDYTLFDHPLRYGLALLATSWTGGARPEWAEHGTATSFYLARLSRLEERMRRGSALPLLSTPTHRGGHLALGAFEERLARWRDESEPLDPYDAVLALMRLPPAARAGGRLLLGEHAEGKAFELAATATSAVHRFRVARVPVSEHAGYYQVHAEPDPACPVAASLLAARRWLMHEESGGGGHLVAFIATMDPHDLGPHFAMGARVCDFQLDEPSFRAGALQVALQPWARLGTQGHWLLALALASRGVHASAVALDVAVDGIDQGRVEPAVLGDVLAALMTSGMLKAKRLAASLAEVAQVSSRHRDAVGEIVARALRGNPDDAPRDVASLLSLLYELLIESGQTLADAGARDWLLAARRGGKVAKLRKSLLAM